MLNARPTTPQARIYMPPPPRNHSARASNTSAPINMLNAKPNTPQAPTCMPPPSRTHPARAHTTQPPEPTRHWGMHWKCCQCGSNYTLPPGLPSPEDLVCNVKTFLTGDECGHPRCDKNCGEPPRPAPPPKSSMDKMKGFFKKK